MIETSEFIGNSCTSNGGAIHMYGGDMAVDRCLIALNSAVWRGGGVHVRNAATLSVTQSTFSDNSGEEGGNLSAVFGGQCTIESSILSFAGEGASVYCNAGSYDLSCSNVYGNVGGDWPSCVSAEEGASGNFSLDPAFCDTSAQDYSIDFASPCSDGNHPDSLPCGLIGAYAPACGGATATETVSWGALKEMFR
ncbi:MAG: hypothetical protein HKN20_02890 [Gemmatimonadetes bacterium]|nr:hypothetical protein [Gemmatimonadota bacterium]